MTVCSIEGCGRRVQARGWCSKHYQRWRKWGITDDPTRQARSCSVDGCDGRSAAHGWCAKHYARWLHHGTTDLTPLRPRCSADGCSSPARDAGMCRMHHDRWLRTGTTEPQPRVGRSPLVCVCPEPDADPRVDFGQCQRCFRIPVALMHGRFAPKQVA